MMDPKWQAFFFGLALLCFLLDAFETPRKLFGIVWISLGLALFTFPWLWANAAAGW